MAGRLSCFQLRRLAVDKWWLQLRLHGYALRHAAPPSRVTPNARALISLSAGYNYQRYITLNCLPLTGRQRADTEYALDNRRRIAC